MSEILLDALSVVRGYLIQNYNKGEQDTVWNEIFEVTRNRAGDSIYPKGLMSRTHQNTDMKRRRKFSLA